MVDFRGTHINATSFTTARKARPSCAEFYETHTYSKRISCTKFHPNRTL